ncbi:transposase [Lentisphaera profundi]|uniref:Transposase n=1 Tax=Lentisphaera profundi TaxID=1658616 RepID=A0ABY7VPC8_9BACT|nr:transposase [Lentisphaera profundi]WDE95569.1 transposase [Lentisphaera profundi]
METRTEHSVGEIFRRFGQTYEGNHSLLKEQRKTLQDIAMCRTAYLGGHNEVCCKCGSERPVYNSCGNTNCPMCQGIRRRRWLNERLDELLPVSYFHSIFTLPHELNPIARFNQREIYNLLFRTAADSLLHLSKKYHDSIPVIIATLHTWGQDLCLHPHVHILVTSGGMKKDGTWKAGREDYLFDVFEASAEFKKRFLRKLKSLYKHKKLVNTQDFTEIYKIIEGKPWVVNIQKPFSGAEVVVEYLSRYVYRSAIANSRITAVENSFISFDIKDYKDLDEKGIARHKDIRMKPQEFIRRFMQHVLPKGFRRSRFYGLFAGAQRTTSKEYCKILFAELLKEFKANERFKDEAWQPKVCDCCGNSDFKRGNDLQNERPPPILFHYRRGKLHA